MQVSPCKDSAGYRGGGQSEEKCKESNSWNAEEGRKEGAEKKRSVDRLVLAVSVFVVGARLSDQPENSSYKESLSLKILMTYNFRPL